jgi:trehalose 6-phosphate phosphatase
VRWTWTRCARPFRRHWWHSISTARSHRYHRTPTTRVRGQAPIPGIDKGTAIRELIGDDTAAALYAGDDLGDLPAMAEVKAWAERSGRPTLTVGVSPRGRGPIAEQTDVTVPDPQSLISLLRQIVA